jgi:hypothetical protein
VLFWLNERLESRIHVTVRSMAEEGGNKYVLHTVGTLRHATSVITEREFGFLSDCGVGSEELTDAYAVGEWSMLTLNDYPGLRGWTGSHDLMPALEVELDGAVNLLVVDHGRQEEEENDG